MNNKSVKRIVAEGAFMLSVSSVLTKALWLLISLLVLHFLTVKEFGMVELIFSATSMLSIFSLPGVYNIVLNDIGIEKRNKNYANMYALLRQYFIYIFITNFTAWAIMFFGADLITEKFSSLAGGLIRIMSFSFIVSPFWGISQVLLMMESRFGYISLHQLSMAVSKLFFIVFFISTGGLTVTNVIFSHVVMDYVGMVVVIPTVYFLIGKIKKQKRDENKYADISLLNILLKHGKWAIFATYLNDFNKSFRLWVIKLMIGTEAVGLYSAAFGFLTQVRTLLPLQRILSSMIPQYDIDSSIFSKLLIKGIKYNIFGNIVIMLLSSISMPIIVFILLPQYKASIILFELMLFSMLPISVGGILSIVFFVLKKQRNLFFANILRLISTMVFLPLLIIFFGLYGAAFELTTASFVFMFERIRMFKKEMPNLRLSLSDVVSYDSLDRKILNSFLSKIKLF